MQEQQKIWQKEWRQIMGKSINVDIEPDADFDLQFDIWELEKEQFFRLFESFPKGKEIAEKAYLLNNENGGYLDNALTKDEIFTEVRNAIEIIQQISPSEELKNPKISFFSGDDNQRVELLNEADILSINVDDEISTFIKNASGQKGYDACFFLTEPFYRISTSYIDVNWILWGLTDFGDDLNPYTPLLKLEYNNCDVAITNDGVIVFQLIEEEEKEEEEKHADINIIKQLEHHNNDELDEWVEYSSKKQKRFLKSLVVFANNHPEELKQYCRSVIPSYFSSLSIIYEALSEYSSDWDGFLFEEVKRVTRLVKENKADMDSLDVLTDIETEELYDRNKKIHAKMLDFLVSNLDLMNDSKFSKELLEVIDWLIEDIDDNDPILKSEKLFIPIAKMANEGQMKVKNRAREILKETGNGNFIQSSSFIEKLKRLFK